MKNLILRSITGIIYVGLICASVLSGGWLFIVFFGLIAILALEDFITSPMHQPAERMSQR